jgi:hypothetical protein
MTVYTVLAPKLAGAAEPDPARFAFVKEGFCWPAFFFLGLWLIFRRMWLVLALTFAVIVALVVLASAIGALVPVVVLIFARFLFALEANELRRWTLSRAGYRLIGVAEGRRRDDAEIRFFRGWSPPSPPPPDEPPPRPPVSLSPEAGGVVGLFPSPGVAP